MTGQVASGLGGVFFRATDPVALARWYEENFGITAMTDGSAEPWRQEAGFTVFAPFPADTDYFPAGQPMMLNLRVADLDAMLDQLRGNGVRIDEYRQDESYGRFAWVYDPEGSKIELWEPAGG